MSNHSARPLSERQRQALGEMLRLCAARAKGEVDLERARQQRQDAADIEFADTKEIIEKTFAEARRHADMTIVAARHDIPARFEEEKAKLDQDYAKAKEKAHRNFAANKSKTESEYKETRWTILTLYEADKKVARDQLALAQSRIKKIIEDMRARQQNALKLLKQWKLGKELALELKEVNLDAGDDPWQILDQLAGTVTGSLQELRAMRLPRFLRGAWPWAAGAALWAVLSLPALLLESWYIWLATSTAATPLLAWPLWLYLAHRVRRQALFHWARLRQAVHGSKSVRKTCLEQARQSFKRNRKQSKAKHQKALDQAMDAGRKELKASKLIHEQELYWAEERYRRTLEKRTRQRDVDLQAAEDRYQQQTAEIQAVYDRELAQATARYQKHCEEHQRRHHEDWSKLAEEWKQGSVRFLALLKEIDEQCRTWFPPWESATWQNWPAAREIPQALPLGRLDVTSERLPHAVPRSPLLPRLDLADKNFPALLAFPERASLLLEATDQGREAGVHTLQAILLRAWTALPPGKMRCTILDPVGRGENFASFMHLADHDDLLVTGRIWTEVSHIDQRLEDLTAHMENVLQKYLRNQYKSLAEYNAQAGEMAEPFRFLVIANFPVNCTPEACRRVISLAKSGARCGIYTLVMADTKVSLPQGIELEDLEEACSVLRWHKDRFLWIDEDFASYPLELAKPPAADFMASVLDQVGKRAKDAGRVEVPFDVVAPSADKWWTSDSRAGISVPLGRVGATGQQFLTLGQGTSQHVLIAGKTGSGKSTLLHALITQLALRYSPTEVELYLIDFKKGVEFKTYAANNLPHARVVAVESEREFGLSVLQRLDAELVRRGELFRIRGVNDLPSFRAGHKADNGDPAGAMPRMLLIVDEFQEFFVEDDKIAQEAALLLDRLVRQGRAFGIHIVLGSQTLGGAFSLARSTLDQMAVRIALQCSEADAHLILSKDNGDARLLSRPGEAIYNDAGGLIEANSLFQVVWLTDAKRDDYLLRLQGLAQQRAYQPPQPQIVFEGTAPAVLEKNSFLVRALEEPPAAPLTAWHAWLGDAIAIKDPTVAVFRRHSGANLLFIGQNGDAAFNMMVSSMIGLAGQVPPSSAGKGNGQPASPSEPHSSSLDSLAPFHVVMATPLEGDAENLCNALPEMLPIQLVPQRDLPELLNKLVDEVNRRQKEPGDAPPVFLFLHGLQRLRDLRRPEDDFGFGRKGDDKPNPYRQFITLTREGPPLGVFSFVWCDSLHNLQRTLDRQTMREFEMRVLFQMSAADSSNLIDSPAATKLGLYRALYYTEDQGRTEKFRPYGLADLAWLKQAQERISWRRSVKVG